MKLTSLDSARITSGRRRVVVNPEPLPTHKPKKSEWASYHRTRISDGLAAWMGSRNAVKKAMRHGEEIPVGNLVIKCGLEEVRPYKVLRCNGVLVGLWCDGDGVERAARIIGDQISERLLVPASSKALGDERVLPGLNVPLPHLRASAKIERLFATQEVTNSRSIRLRMREAVWRARDTLACVSPEAWSLQIEGVTYYICLRLMMYRKEDGAEWMIATEPTSQVVPTEDEVDIAARLMRRGWTVIPPEPDGEPSEVHLNFRPILDPVEPRLG